MRVLIVVLLALVLPTAAQAARGPCIVGTATPRCEIWRATAPFGAGDGDTLDVHVEGTPKRRFAHVRITGINAMELTRHDGSRVGECHAAAAAGRLDALLAEGRRRVRLAAMDAASASRRRPLRSVAVKIGGVWVDVGQALVEEGLALWLPHRVEHAWNFAYGQAQRRASAAAVGLFDADACGAGPSDASPLQLWVNSNPAGADAYALEDEFVTVRNNDPVNPVDLTGWWVRDSGMRRYVFGAGTVLPPGGTVTVRVGAGDDTVTDRYWGLRRPTFGNATSDGTYVGDGGYLFDPQGDLRAWMLYPCWVDCRDPLQGLVRIASHPVGREYVTVTNLAPFPIDLQGYRLFTKPYGYAFGPDSVLQPSESVRVIIQGYPEDDVHGRKHWGLTGNILRNAGDVVTVKTFDDIVIGCEAWGDAAC